MSIQTIRRYLCDAPNCTTTSTGENLPEDWTRLSSAAHLEGKAPRTTRPRSRTLSLSERSAGAIRLHLCPAHPDAFAAHTPMTSSAPARRRDDPEFVTVSCSCGASLGGVRNVIQVAPRRVGPNHGPEYVWWSHLPAEFQQYALRRDVLNDDNDS